MLNCHRIVFSQDIEHLFRAAQNPEGRFHHNGQSTLYLSLSQEGAIAALRYYAKAEDPPRLMVNLTLVDANLVDISDTQTCENLGIIQSHSTSRWQDERKSGKSATTWLVSDIVRDSGADGMVYRSRTQPDLAHLVLFHWNPPQLAQIGDPTLITSDALL